jgi:hypothetical protein
MSPNDSTCRPAQPQQYQYWRQSYVARKQLSVKELIEQLQGFLPGQYVSIEDPDTAWRIAVVGIMSNDEAIVGYGDSEVVILKCARYYENVDRG